MNCIHNKSTGKSPAIVLLTQSATRSALQSQSSSWLAWALHSHPLPT